MDRALLEERLSELPLFQYEFFSPQELTVPGRGRPVSLQESPEYGKSGGNGRGMPGEVHVL